MKKLWKNTWKVTEKKWKNPGICKSGKVGTLETQDVPHLQKNKDVQ